MRYITLLVLLTLVSLTAHSQRLDKHEKRELRERGIYEYFKLPEGKKNGKRLVSYSKQKSVANTDKARLFKRAELFIAQQNWGNVEHIRCKDGVTLSSQLVDKEILYSDEQEGIIVGQGYSFFPLEKTKHFYLTFMYKITVSDTGYTYEFDQFEILEFVRGPMSKGKASAVAYGGIASGGSRTRFYDVDLRSYPVEEFFSERIINDGYHGDLTGAAIRKLKDVYRGLSISIKETMSM